MIDEVSFLNIRKAFQSILRADYVSINDIDQLKQLDGYYVDFFNNVSKVLLDQDSYISGRRGTGKTTLLLRSYYECFKTVAPRIRVKSSFFGEKKVLPIYIDLSQCKDIFSVTDTDLLERSFITRIVKELQSQLNVIFESSRIKFLKTDKSKLEEFDYIEKLLIEGLTLKKAEKSISEINQESSKASLDGQISLTNASLGAKLEEIADIKTTKEIEIIKSISVQEFLTNLGNIRKACGLDAIYVFADEFSDLSEDEQSRFSILLKKLLGSKNNIFFKVGVITDRFYFGEQIIVGRDIFPIPLDLNDFVERYGGIVPATKVLEEFTTSLIKKRLDTYTQTVKFEDVVRENQQEIITRISREAMGVPRTIGLILLAALNQAEIDKKDNRISLNCINVGIHETRRMYFKQFQGAISKRVIPGFYMDMWNSILERVLFEKGKNKKEQRPASHFMIDPIRKNYLNIFCENFIIHYLEDSRASKYGGNYLLFALDYDICVENNVNYAEKKDEFTAARFIYDSVLAEYDCYFMKDKIKSYKCPKCNIIYQESEVKNIKVKRCFECDDKLVEIIHQEVPISEGNYTEIEVKILGLIGTLSKEEAMTATEIGDIVGCSWQKVANWCSKVLGKKDLIEIEKRGNKNFYYDKVE